MRNGTVSVKEARAIRSREDCGDAGVSADGSAVLPTARGLHSLARARVRGHRAVSQEVRGRQGVLLTNL